MTCTPLPPQQERGDYLQGSPQLGGHAGVSWGVGTEEGPTAGYRATPAPAANPKAGICGQTGRMTKEKDM